MSRKALKIIAVVLLILVVGGLGFINQEDPLWLKLDEMLEADYITLQESKDSIEERFQRLQSSHGSMRSGYKRLSHPFLPTMTFEKFDYYYNKVAQNKFIVLASVSGIGASTLSNRLANFIATHPENLLQIDCAPNFDLIFHHRYIGDYDENGLFQQKSQFLVTP